MTVRVPALAKICAGWYWGGWLNWFIGLRKHAAHADPAVYETADTTMDATVHGI